MITVYKKYSNGYYVFERVLSKCGNTKENSKFLTFSVINGNSRALGQIKTQDILAPALTLQSPKKMDTKISPAYCIL